MEADQNSSTTEAKKKDVSTSKLESEAFTAIFGKDSDEHHTAFIEADQCSSIMEAKKKDASTSKLDEDFTAVFDKDSEELHTAFIEADQSSSISESKKKDASTSTLESEDFTAVFDKDSEYNSKLWSALADGRFLLPKKGDLVVYFPQGHLEYASLIATFPSEEFSTFNLQPQIICRVVHVQLLAKKKDDEICANITLLPEPEEKELEDSSGDEEEDRRTPTKSTSHFFHKRLNAADTKTLSVPLQADKLFSPKDIRSLGSVLMVDAEDFRGMQWSFQRKLRGTQRYQLTSGWSRFVQTKGLVAGDKVVFLRGQDGKLKLGTVRAGHYNGDILDSIIAKHYHNPNVLSSVADAISNKSMFDVLYSPRSRCAEFVIPYRKYMKSIANPVLAGEKVILQCRMRSVVVDSIADCDPYKWPNSKWRCLKVYEEKYKEVKESVSPWDIFCEASSSIMTQPSSRQIQDNSSGDSETDGSVYSPRYPPMQQPRLLFLDEDENLELNKPFLSSFQSSSLDFKGDTIIPPLVIKKQAPPTPFQFTPYQRPATQETLKKLETDRGSFLTSFQRSAPTFNLEQLLITKRSEQEIVLDLSVQYSIEYLVLDSCLFTSPSLPWDLPITLKKLKIANCLNIEHIIAKLIDQKDLSLESLEIDGCSSLHSFLVHRLPATLRHLKIVNCMNLKSLGEYSEFKNCDSDGFGPMGDSSLPSLNSTSTLELRKLEIQDCMWLEFLPECLHNLTHLELLSISNCSSLVSFPEGGLPNTCLTSLLIYECENLKFLPNELHMVASLQNLSICGCPSLMFFPEGGLPRNLVSLRIMDCENLISVSEWELHKLKQLRIYSISWGCSDSGE